MAENLKKLMDLVKTPLPKSLISSRAAGGGRNLSYLSVQTVIDMLNDVFGYDWNWTIQRQWIEHSAPSVYKGDVQEQEPVAHVTGRLEVPIIGENGEVIRVIVKEASGSKRIIGKASEQESMYKSAASDALKKAASLFGIGLELARSDAEQQYFDTKSYVSPWEDEATVKKYEPIWNRIEKIKQDNNWGEEEIVQCVASYFQVESASMTFLMPENIEGFTVWLEEQLAEMAATPIAS